MVNLSSVESGTKHSLNIKAMMAPEVVSTTTVRFDPERDIPREVKTDLIDYVRDDVVEKWLDLGVTARYLFPHEDWNLFYTQDAKDDVQLKIDEIDDYRNNVKRLVNAILLVPDVIRDTARLFIIKSQLYKEMNGSSILQSFHLTSVFYLLQIFPEDFHQNDPILEKKLLEFATGVRQDLDYLSLALVAVLQKLLFDIDILTEEDWSILLDYRMRLEGMGNNRGRETHTLLSLYLKILSWDVAVSEQGFIFSELSQIKTEPASLPVPLRKEVNP